MVNGVWKAKAVPGFMVSSLAPPFCPWLNFWTAPNDNSIQVRPTVSKRAKNSTEPFKMSFDPTTIEHLGLRLYSTLPPVIAELVSNSYDADSPKVEVILPEGPLDKTSEVIVRDWGHSMTPEEVRSEYLVIGRKRRGKTSDNRKSKSGKRSVTGRKGLGKLAGFGVADEIEVRAVKDGSAITLRLSFQDILDWVEQTGNPDYEPAVIESRSGETKDADGVEVILRKLRRKNRISADTVRKGLARRLTSIGLNFQVLVNGKGPQPGDRIDKGRCVLSWDISEIPAGTEIQVGSEHYRLSGWIGFVPGSSQGDDRGIDVFATGKAVQLASYFNFSSTHAQFARSHVVGEVNAQFLDEDEDLISTARNAVVWETEEGQALQRWGQDVLPWAFDQWVRFRRNKRQEKTISVGGFDRWLETRTSREQRAAKKMVDLLIKDDKMDPDSVPPLLEIIKGSVESAAFHELLDALAAGIEAPAKTLELFNEWRVIEAREHLAVADGRMKALQQLNNFINKGAHELKEVEPLIAEHSWMFDPAWKEVDVQQRYSKLLRENCKEPTNLQGTDRRLDILGIKVSGALTVIELKHPTKTLSRPDLEQIEKYVDWARAHIVGGTGPDAPKTANGMLLVGKLSSNVEVRQKIRRLQGDDIRVEAYPDLLTRARAYHKEIEKRLEAVAPEYLKYRRKPKGNIEA